MPLSISISVKDMQTRKGRKIFWSKIKLALAMHTCADARLVVRPSLAAADKLFDTGKLRSCKQILSICHNNNRVDPATVKKYGRLSPYGVAFLIEAADSALVTTVFRDTSGMQHSKTVGTAISIAAMLLLPTEENYRELADNLSRENYNIVVNQLWIQQSFGLSPQRNIITKAMMKSLHAKNTDLTRLRLRILNHIAKDMYTVNKEDL